MKIVSTFGGENSKLWTVCYNEDRGQNGRKKDIFSEVFRKWNNEEYLARFFKENESDLKDPFWEGMTIHEAKTQVFDEALDFEIELRNIELRKPGYEECSLQDIFHQLHLHEFSLKPQFSRFRKGKPNFPNAMLRLYGIELEDGCLIITGGAIKLTARMDRPHLERENRKLMQVQDFLKEEGIYSKKELL